MGMVAVLQAVLCVPANGLKVRLLIFSDPNLGLGGRNGELLDAVPYRHVAYGPPFSIQIFKPLSTTATSETKIRGFYMFQTIAAAKFMGV